MSNASIHLEMACEDQDAAAAFYIEARRYMRTAEKCNEVSDKEWYYWLATTAQQTAANHSACARYNIHRAING